MSVSAQTVTPTVEVGQIWYCADSDGTRYIEITSVSVRSNDDKGPIQIGYTAYAKWAWPNRKRYPINSTMLIDSLFYNYKMATPVKIAALLSSKPSNAKTHSDNDAIDEITSIKKKLNSISQQQVLSGSNFKSTMKILHDKQNSLETKLDKLIEALGG